MQNKNAYFDYLTKRLDSGESKNVVIGTTANAIQEQLEVKDRVGVLDIGCFSGAMLNRIRLELPKKLRGSVDWVGVDADKDAMAHGALKYGDIEFVEADLENELSLAGEYDVIILCNILHELFIGEESPTRKRKIMRVFRNISSLLTKNGEVIILDGVEPENAKSKTIVELASEEWVEKFEKLVKDYKAVELIGKRLTGNRIETDQLTLAVFLTKARYLDKEYWTGESNQLYQLFSAGDFRKMVEKAGLFVKKLEPQFSGENVVTEMINSVSPNITFPAKNLLVVAKKK